MTVTQYLCDGFPAAININGIKAVRYDDIHRMDEIKSLSFHIMFYRLFRDVAKYIVYGNTFSSFE